MNFRVGQGYDVHRLVAGRKLILGGVEIAGEKYQLELRLVDDASDPARATTLVQRLIDEGVDFAPIPPILSRDEH